MQSRSSLAINSPRTARSICDIRSRPLRSCCIRVPKEIIHDPDPAIYDQRLLFSSGALPTFNSPDISTVNLWPVRPIGNLTATLRNLSTEASANQTRVDLSWSQWGIGMPRLPIASSFIDLARAGFPGNEATLTWPLPPALEAAKRFGVFVDLLHPYDKDNSNNQGEQTVDGFQTSEGRNKSFVVPVRNPSGSAATINMIAGPGPIVPWVTIVPATFTLGGGAQNNVMVAVAVPGGIPASPAGTLISATVDVLATIDGAYLGGVSILILFDA
jgi:hypothetical protein